MNTDRLQCHQSKPQTLQQCHQSKPQTLQRTEISQFLLQKYGIELFENVDSKIRGAHRYMVKRFYPRSFYVRDANNIDIRSTTLYHEIAGCESLEERHASIREKMIEQTKMSRNSLIKNLIGTLPVPCIVGIT